MKANIEELIGEIFVGIISLGFAITLFVGLIKLCIWIWSI